MENNKGFLKGLITGALLMAATALLGFSIYIGAGSWDAKTAAVMEPKEESAILTKVRKLAGYIEKQHRGSVFCLLYGRRVQAADGDNNWNLLWNWCCDAAKS